VSLALILAVVSGVFSSAIAQSSDPSVESDQSDPLQPFIERAYGLPPEFQADLLLRLADMTTLPKLKRQLVEQALEQSRNVDGNELQSAVAFRIRGDVALIPPVEPWRLAAEVGLDQGSLHARGWLMLSKIDVKAAAEEALSFSPSTAHAKCIDWKIPDQRLLFEALSRLANDIDDQVLKESLWLKLATLPNNAVDHFRAGSQLMQFDKDPAARNALASWKAQVMQFRPRASDGLAIIHARDRFSLIVTLAEAMQAGGNVESGAIKLLQMIDEAVQQDDSCDAQTTNAAALSDELQAAIKQIKSEGTWEKALQNLDAPLSSKTVPESLKVSGVDALSESMQPLAIKDGKAITNAERASSEWRRRLEDVLLKAERWQPGADDDRVAFFHWKANFLESMVDFDPEQASARFYALAEHLGKNRSAIPRQAWFGELSKMLTRLERHPQKSSWSKIWSLTPMR
jgi:hypothetical protein